MICYRECPEYISLLINVTYHELDQRASLMHGCLMSARIRTLPESGADAAAFVDVVDIIAPLEWCACCMRYSVWQAEQSNCCSLIVFGRGLHMSIALR